MKAISTQQPAKILAGLRRIIPALVLLVVLSTMAATVSAQPCANYGNFIHWLGGAECDGAYNGNLSVDLPYVYLCTWDRGLWAFDVSDPVHPVSSNISTLAGRKFWKQGNRALMDQHSYEDPPGWPYFRKLLAVDCSDPMNPVPQESVVIAENIMDVEFYGDLAMIAADDSGLVFLDISNLDNLQIVHCWGSDTRVFSVELMEELAFVGTAKGLFVLDLTDPLQPEVVGYVGGDHLVVTLDRDLLVTGNGYENRLYDVRDPRNPVFREVIEGGSLGAPELDNGVLLQREINGVSITPTMGTGAVQKTTEMGVFRSSVMQDGKLYAHSDVGLEIFDLVQGDVPVPASQLSAMLIVDDVSYRDGYAFLAASPFGLHVFNMSTMEEVTNEELNEELTEIELKDELAILAGYNSFFVLDVTNPEAFTVLSSLTDLPMGARDMELQDDIAWVLNYTGDSAFGFDFSDPDRVQQMGTLVLPEGTTDMAVDDDLMYVVGSSENDLQIFDLSVASPSVVASFDLGATGVSVSVENGIAAICLQDGNILLVYVGNLSTPELVTTVSSWAVGQVILQGNSLSVSNRYCLQMFDVSSVENPEHLGEFWTPNRGHLRVPHGEFLLWDKLERSLVMAPRPCGGGPVISRPVDPETKLMDIGPNPFNPRTTLEFQLPKPGFCRLVIHDLRGYEVQTLCAEELSGGAHRFVWQGKDHSGKPVPSGLYLARLEYAGAVETQKLALVK